MSRSRYGVPERDEHAAVARPGCVRSVRPSLPGSAQPEVLSRSPAETVAVVGDCLIVVVEQTLSALGVSAIQRGLQLLGSKYQEVGYLSYIHGDSCTSMDSQARQLMADVVARHTRRIGAAAMVVTGTGFRPTVVRSVLTGIHLASRASHPLKVFPRVEPALDWYGAKRPRRRTSNAVLWEALRTLQPSGAEAAAEHVS